MEYLGWGLSLSKEKKIRPDQCWQADHHDHAERPFDSAMSFAMIRGQHVQMTVLGAMEVSENGDIAN